MKRLVALLSVIAICIALVGCGVSSTQTTQDKNSDSQNTTQNGQPTTDDATTTIKSPYATGTHHAVVHIKGYGAVALELYSDDAPLTVKTFCNLVDRKYYNGKTLYALLQDMYVKIGTNSSTDSKYIVKGEYQEAGGSNNLALKRGILAMARSEDGKHSDASTFIIFLSDVSYLDGKYAAFGRVTDGLEIIDAICSNAGTADDSNIRINKDGLIMKAKSRPVIESMTMID